MRRLTAGAIDEVVRGISRSITNFARQAHPEDMETIMGAMLANVCGRMPQEYFDAFVARMGEPCGRENCRCHIYAAAIKPGFIAARKDWLEVKALGMDPKING